VNANVFAWGVFTDKTAFFSRGTDIEPVAETLIIMKEIFYAAKIILIKNTHFNTNEFHHSAQLEKNLLERGFQKEILSNGFIETFIHSDYHDDNNNTVVYVTLDGQIYRTQETIVEGPKFSKFMDTPIPQGYKVEFRNRKIDDYNKAWDVEGSTNTSVHLATEVNGEKEKRTIKREDIIALTDDHGTRRS